MGEWGSEEVSRHPGPCELCHHNLYIGIKIFPHIDNTQSTDHNYYFMRQSSIIGWTRYGRIGSIACHRYNAGWYRQVIYNIRTAGTCLYGSSYNMAQCNTAVTPVHIHWSYYSLALRSVIYGIPTAGKGLYGSSYNMTQCNTAVTPVHIHWSYNSLALRSYMVYRLQVRVCMGHHIIWLSAILQ